MAASLLAELPSLEEQTLLAPEQALEVLSPIFLLQALPEEHRVVLLEGG